MAAITAEALTKTYTDFVNRNLSVTALSDVTISVARGEIFGLLGRNGAGKTTFIKILLGLVHPTSGRASILGKDLSNARVRERVGFLPENHRFPNYLTGAQTMSLFGGLYAMSASRIRSRTQELLKLVGMEQWAAMKVRKYSKGMMQRLGLAQALINNPDVIFLDEPTDGVDPVGRKEIRDVLKQLKAEGKTIFLNSHLLSEVEMISDRVAILDKGSLLKVGTVAEFTTADASYEIGFAHLLSEAFYHEAAATVLKFSVEKSTIFAEVKDSAELNHLIDLMRKHAIEITHIAKKRTSLEDSFISLIQ